MISFVQRLLVAHKGLYLSCSRVLIILSRPDFEKCEKSILPTQAEILLHSGFIEVDGLDDLRFVHVLICRMG